MRHSWLVLACLLAAGLRAQGQQQQPAPAPPPPDPQLQARLDEVLQRWEQKMRDVQTLSAEVVREKTDVTFKTKEVYVGRAKYMRPNLALLDLHDSRRPERFERFICTGTYLYEYDQPNSVIRVHELPPPKPGQVSDDNFLSFIFGMKADEAKRRYDLSIFYPRGTDDPNYIYIQILPRFANDKADFKKAYLALTKTTFLPRMLIFDEPNGNRVQWDIPVVETGVQLDRLEFTKPTQPTGWKIVLVPRQEVRPAQGNEPPPRVVRPKQ
jgi:TIGR03009 family protein